MKIKTSEATNGQLDRLVAKIEKVDYSPEPTTNSIGMTFDATNYTTDWAIAGPIIDSEKITLDYHDAEGWWEASIYLKSEDELVQTRGVTALIAAMRCYVASKLGEEVEVPDELAT